MIPTAAGRATLAGAACALASAALVGLVNVVLKHAFDRGADPLPLLAVAYVLAFALTLPWLLRFRVRARSDVWPLAASALAGVVLAPLALVLGLERTSAVTASLLVNLEILFTGVLAAVFLRERLTRGEALALALVALGGLAVTVGPDLARGERPGSGSLVGAALVASAGFMWSVDSTINTRLTRDYELLPLLAAKFAVAAAALPLVAIAVSGTVVPPAFAWPHVAFNGVLGILASVLLFFVALRTVGATRTVVLFSTAGLWGALGGWAFLGEPLTWPHFAGAALMMAGVFAFTRLASGRSA